MSRIANLIMISTISITAMTDLSYAQSARTEESWKPITTEPSRDELFKEYADASIKENSGGTQSFAFPYSFRFPLNALKDIDGSDRENIIFGIDISSYQGHAFPFEILQSKSISFIYVKATQGTDIADKSFGYNWETLKDLQPNKTLPRGAYHFLSSDPTQADQIRPMRSLRMCNYMVDSNPTIFRLQWISNGM
jgi:hypothetical protein